MNRLLSAIVVIFTIFLLNSCGEVDDLVDSVSGSDDDSTASNENPRKDVTPTTTTPTTTTPTTGTKTSTDSTASYPNVAGHGILWKPVSESDKKLAVLLKSSYGVPTVNILDANKNLIEKGRFVYKSNPDRATYRFSRPGGGFPKPCLIQVGGQIFRVPDGSKRYE